jgi:signal transduction histidine kinase
MRVSDNGSGLKPRSPKQKGMGLHIMQSRAGMIGGRFAVERNAAGGVVIMCSVPKRAMSAKLK